MAIDPSLREKDKVKKRGKRDNQKIKPYVVLQYLMKNTDENNVASALDIIAFLEDLGIAAERRSIYRDIDDVNKVFYAMENECTVDEAADELAEDEDDELKVIVYDKKKKGFYVKQRNFDLNDMRLLAESIYSARFMTAGQAERLVDTVCEFVSEAQAKKIRHDALLTDRIRTDNKSTLINISTITEAMSKEVEGQPHVPSKIGFEYLFHTVGSLDKPQARRNKYKVSPYHLLINDGNYYLLAFDDKTQSMRTYRVDRMRKMEELNEKREGADEFYKINLASYTQRHFGMFSGEEEFVQIRFVNSLLDTVLEKVGTKGAVYTKQDDNHFIMKAPIEISDPFYAWVFGFGRRAKLLGPPKVVEGFKDYLKKVSEMY